MSKRTKVPPPSQVSDAAVPAKPRVMDSFGLRSPPSKKERAAEVLAPLTEMAAEMKRRMTWGVEAANFGSKEERAHRERFEGYLPDLGKMIKASRGALQFFNDGAERYGEEPISPAAAKALDDCAAEIDARIAHQEATAKAEREEVVRRIPRLAARNKAGRRPLPTKDLEAEAVSALRAKNFSAADAKRLAREYLESVGLRIPPAPKQK